MGGAARVQSEFEELLPEEQQEILDFIAFLKARRGGKAPLKRPKSVPIEKDPFVGIWADRVDLADSARWVRETRKREWSD